MNILITGGTGFVGKHLTKALLAESGNHICILTRSPEQHTNTDQISYASYNVQADELPTIHAVINLAGDSLFGYWTKKKKLAIHNSRINVTQKLIDLIEKMEKKPEVLISGSAVGFYGTSEDLMFTEKTTKPGDDFLADVVADWEKTASQAEQMGIRTVYTRFGVILGNEGALSYMKLPVKMFAGGKIGNGEQWVPWVHIEDVVRLIQFVLFNKNIQGPVNVTAPNPKRNKDFTKVLAEVLKRPYWFPAPSPLIRVTIGEMSQLITKGQYVFPAKAKENDFTFSYPYLTEALREVERTEKQQEN